MNGLSHGRRLDQPVVKICGLTRKEDVQACLDAGADALGFIFVDRSPRQVSPEMVANMPQGRAARVGVFAGQTVDEIHRIMHMADLDLAQLHGGEDAAFCRAVGAERVIKVLWPERLLAAYGLTPETVTPAFMAGLLHEAGRRFADSCAWMLFDAGMQGGGSGRTLPFSILREFRSPRPWLLAGGVNPENAGQALRESFAPGLDGNSGLESAPGIKVAAKIHDLINTVRQLSSAKTAYGAQRTVTLNRPDGAAGAYV